MSIFLAGDVLLEQLLQLGDGYDSYSDHTAKKAAETPMSSRFRLGGAALTAALLAHLGEERDSEVVHALPVQHADWGKEPCGSEDGHRVARQTLGLMKAPIYPGSRALTYRVRRMLSLDYYTAPPELVFETQLAKALPGSHRLVVIEDLHLGGYHSRSDVIREINELGAATTILKTTRPLPWAIEISQLDQPVILVGNINNFFLNGGFSRKSWDVVLRETARALSECSSSTDWRLILLCENEGIVMAQPDSGRIRLWFGWDRQLPLGGLAHGNWGWVPGCQNILVAHLAEEMDKADSDVISKPERLWEMILSAWECARSAGYYGIDLQARSLYDLDLVFGSTKSASEDEQEVARRSGPSSWKWRICDPATEDDGTVFDTWSIFAAEVERFEVKGRSEQRRREALRYLAYFLVARGPSVLVSPWPGSEDGLYSSEAAEDAMHFAGSVPVHQIGSLISLDGKETDELARLTELISDYAQRERPARPLSIAVFGRPGSGKSFAVREILGDLQINSDTLSFNLSQFTSVDDITNAMHSAQTAGLRNQLPVVFWDEFDCDCDGRPKGWLRYFLAPMQDGEFLGGGVTHVIGRAIFVFAGGVSTTSQDFYSPGESGQVASDQQIKDEEAKVPDFASRLKAVYNVPSIRLEEAGDGDLLCTPRNFATILRRALVVRRSLLRHAPRVDEVSCLVLERLLFSGEYVTARDIETAVEAAPLTSGRTFGDSHLSEPLWTQRNPVPRDFRENSDRVIQLDLARADS